MHLLEQSVAQSASARRGARTSLYVELEIKIYSKGHEEVLMFLSFGSYYLKSWKIKPDLDSTLKMHIIWKVFLYLLFTIKIYVNNVIELIRVIKEDV